MNHARRNLFVASSAGLSAAAAYTLTRPAAAQFQPVVAALDCTRLNVKRGPYYATGNGTTDDTTAIQNAINDAQTQGKVVFFPAGTYAVDGLSVTGAVFLEGVAGKCVLRPFGTPSTLLHVDGATRCSIFGLIFDGRDSNGARIQLGTPSLVRVTQSNHVHLDTCAVRYSYEEGVRWEDNTDGSISRCHFNQNATTAIRSENSLHVRIEGNAIRNGGTVPRVSSGAKEGNGIRIWHDVQEHDGAMVLDNHIWDMFVEDPNSQLGTGCGSSGNGISIYRADNVIASGNRIHDCAYSALRSNRAAGTQFIGNSCRNLGETAIWVEATGSTDVNDGFGAVVSDNIVDTAVRGISLTNFNNDGRLVTCQGNVLRNLGSGAYHPIATGCSSGYCASALKVEAQSVVSGNVIETSTTLGISVGKGSFLSEVIVSNNIIRGLAGAMDYGIAVSDQFTGGASGMVVLGNVISGASLGGLATDTGGCVYTPGLPSHVIAAEHNPSV